MSVPRIACTLALALAALAWSAVVRAALTIEIVGAGANQIPVAVVPLRGEPGGPQSVSQVIGADLQRSGLFKLVPNGNDTPAEPADVRFPDWRARGTDAMVIGTVQQLPDGRYDVRFRLLDVVKQTQITGFAYTVAASQLRATAHKIADAVYEKLTGDPGVFSTRIAYVAKQGKRWELQVADADGANAQTILGSSEPIISPAWAPDGNRLAYVSFEDKKPVVYVQSLAGGERKALAAFRGSNSAPAWSPDGKRLAVTLTLMGNSQLYLINADGTGLERLSNNSHIDTEPSFSPDGQHILFSSDRGGSPQVYRIPAGGGNAERVTFDGSYNVSPRHAPDGKSFVFIRREGGKFNVAVQDFASRQVQVLTTTAQDESPSFAPNGRMILYATQVGGRGILAAVSSDGRVKQRLSASATDIREPAWGPIQR